jgi:hypothetical protein
VEGREGDAAGTDDGVATGVDGNCVGMTCARAMDANTVTALTPSMCDLKKYIAAMVSCAEK